MTNVTQNERNGETVLFYGESLRSCGKAWRKLGRKPTCCVTTFGCQMNARDSEKLVGILEKVGYEIIEDENADFVIYNTCNGQRQCKSARLRKTGGTERLQEEKSPYEDRPVRLHDAGTFRDRKIKTSYRFVDLIFGTHNIFKFAELLCSLFENEGNGH